MISRIGRQVQLKNKGFTFIELILVTIIILILVGLSTPLFRKPFSSIQLKNTSQNLAHLMRYLQAKSIAERKLCRINFDFEQGLFWSTEEDSSYPGKFKEIKGRWGKTVKVPAEISIKGEVSFITFFPDGSSDGETIELSDNRGRAFTITAQKKIGYVKIEE